MQKKYNLKDTLMNTYKLNEDYIVNKINNNKVGAPREKVLNCFVCIVKQ